MRSKPASGERRIEDALAALTDALHRSRIPWMVIGGIAAIARGVRRMTTDIDAVVRGDTATAGSLLRILAEVRIVSRVRDAEAFALESQVLLLQHEPTGVELDVSFGWTEFEHEALAACTSAKYGPVAAPMARAEDLVIFKAMAARPKDIEDASTLLLMHDDIDLDRVRRRLAELAALADEPSLAAGLEQVIQRWSKAANAIDAERPRPLREAKTRARASPVKPHKPVKGGRRKRS